MAPRRIALPEDVPEVFLRAAGVQAGLSAWVLRSPRFTRPFHGVRALAPAVATEPSVGTAAHLETARSYLPRLRDSEAFSHQSALLLHGCPIRSDRDLHVSVLAPRNASRARGVVGHQHATPFETVLVDRRLPVAAPAPALRQAAPGLALAELVVAIDHLLGPRTHPGDRRPALRLDDLRCCAAEAGLRGRRRLEAAFGLARVGAESRMETLLRLILVAFGLFQGFELQVTVHDDRGWIGRFDLVHRARRLIVEYDGEQHRTDAAQYAKDERRVSRAWQAGYHVLRFRYPDVVLDPPGVARAVGRALGAPVPDRPQPGLLSWW